jgi:hypothetical protein
MRAFVFHTLGSLAILLTVSFAGILLPTVFAAPVPDDTSAASSNVSCHGASHDLGSEIAERAATLQDAMLACGDRCTYGCVHGAFTRYFSQRLRGDGSNGTGVAPDVARDIQDLCREDSTILPGFYRGNCAHGVGHAFAAAASDVGGAAAWCGFFESPEMRFYCETGVFMEARHDIRTAIGRDRMSFAARAKAGVEYCAAHASLPGACLRFVWPWAEDVDDARTLVRACARVDDRARRGCVYAAGFVARDYVIDHPEVVGRVCGAALPGDRVFCVAGVVLMKKDHHRRASIPALCRALRDAEMQAVCKDQSGRDYYQLGNPVVRSALGDRSPDGVAGR